MFTKKTPLPFHLLRYYRKFQLSRNNTDIFYIFISRKKTDQLSELNSKTTD